MPGPTAAAEEPEEGEVKVYDEEAYLVSDGEEFSFALDPHTKMDWRQVNEFHSLMFEDPYAVQSLDSGQVAEKHILNNLESIATYDFENDSSGNRNGQWISSEGQKVLNTLQYGMQYYMFAQKHITNKVLTLNNYL